MLVGSRRAGGSRRRANIPRPASRDRSQEVDDVAAPRAAPRAPCHIRAGQAEQQGHHRVGHRGRRTWKWARSMLRQEMPRRSRSRTITG